MISNNTPHLFLTSDNPAASTIQSPVVPAVFSFLPLSPTLCIMILATAWLELPQDTPRSQPEPMGKIRYRATADTFEVFEINRAIVMNAGLVSSCLQKESLARRYWAAPPAPYWGWGSWWGAGWGPYWR